MTKIILDPDLFELDRNASTEQQMEFTQTLKQSIEFVSEHFDAALDDYDGAPYIGASGPPYLSPPITSSPYVKSIYRQFRAGIQRMLLQGQNVDLSEEMPAQCDSHFNLAEEVRTSFFSYLGFIAKNMNTEAENGWEPFMLLSERHSKCVPEFRFQYQGTTIDVPAVFRPATDCHGIVTKYLKKAIDDTMFPRASACKDLNPAFLQDREANKSNPRQLFDTYGTETASRNGYEQEINLTKKNHGFHVFSHSRKTYYISIDMEHGGLELFSPSISRGGGQKRSATHLGEYDFSCKKQKEASGKDHKLYL